MKNVIKNAVKSGCFLTKFITYPPSQTVCNIAKAYNRLAYPNRPFFNELWEKLRNGASLMYTWNIGLGSDFVSVFAYYLASPLNWLVVLFPKSYIIVISVILSKKHKVLLQKIKKCCSA